MQFFFKKAKKWLESLNLKESHVDLAKSPIYLSKITQIKENQK